MTRQFLAQEAVGAELIRIRKELRDLHAGVRESHTLPSPESVRDVMKHLGDVMKHLEDLISALQSPSHLKPKPVRRAKELI